MALTGPVFSIAPWAVTATFLQAVNRRTFAGAISQEQVHG
jgi:hypothetical protein